MINYMSHNMIPGPNRKRFAASLVAMARRALCLLVLGGFFSAAVAPQAHAASPSVPRGTCTSDVQFDVPLPDPDSGLITTIVTNIRIILDNVSENMFKAIAADSEFRKVIRASLSLYIAIYGILFTFGMVQLTVFDFVMRCVKIGIIVWLLSPNDAWFYFQREVVHFFNDGADSVIAKVSAIAVGDDSIIIPDPSKPFAVLDGAISKAISAKMAVTLLATFFTGPYGVLFGLLLLLSLGSFVKALITAVWVYVMSLVLKTLLFGLAPIFLVCLLFNRTRHLFDGWLNQVVNASLQPIFLFTFFAFFAALIDASIQEILNTPVCWTEAAESLRGTPFNMHYWRFAREVPPGSGNWEPYGGLWTWTGADNDANAPHFPISIMSILIFLMLSELAGRFNSVVLMIASDIAGASTNLASMRGALGDWFSPVKGKAEGLLGNVGERKTPGVPGNALAELRNKARQEGLFSALGNEMSNLVRKRGGVD